MDERVAFFQLDGKAGADRGRERVNEAGSGAARAPAAAAAARPKLVSAASGKAAPRPAAKPPVDAGKGPVARMQSQVATAFKQEPDWKEFSMALARKVVAPALVDLSLQPQREFEASRRLTFVLWRRSPMSTRVSRCRKRSGIRLWPAVAASAGAGPVDLRELPQIPVGACRRGASAVRQRDIDEPDVVFREAHHFEHFVSHVIAPFVARHPNGAASCASGQRAARLAKSLTRSRCCWQARSRT